ncbi:hypothetical protein GDO86_000830 [Hymenochirus boettgeri]|uniref:Uncharacterized protein n=1 Tax=Hymenochirus boettgeri TaxID=247094 RepID=A0A8T2KG19_9PIPI|nr:hypothetical protein GDO86_000830 [Hymenochirus boettgeri]
MTALKMASSCAVTMRSNGHASMVKVNLVRSWNWYGRRRAGSLGIQDTTNTCCVKFVTWGDEKTVGKSLFSSIQFYRLRSKNGLNPPPYTFHR